MTGPEGECMGVWKDSGAFNSFTMLRLGVLGDSRVGRSLPLLDLAACTLQLRMLCPHTTHPHVYVHIYIYVCMYVWMDGCASHLENLEGLEQRRSSEDSRTAHQRAGMRKRTHTTS